jgi:hypothetical protein
MKIIKQLFFLTVISEFLTFFLFGLIAIFTQGIRQTLNDVPELILLAVPEYFPIDVFITIVYFFSIRYLVNIRPIFGNLGIRIGSSLLLFLFLMIIALFVYLLCGRLIKGEEVSLTEGKIGDFLVPFAYCPVVVLVNEFVYPKWFFRKKSN